MTMYKVMSKNGRKQIAECETIEQARERIAGTNYGIVYSAEAIAAADLSQSAEKCAKARALASSVSRDYRAIVTLKNREQLSLTVRAHSLPECETIIRSRYADASGIDCWESTK